MIVGITGGTGCGKTTALLAAQELGALVLDCDEIYHELLATDRELLAAIERRFPAAFADGVLERKKLGNIVFSDENALHDLNAITHAAVKNEVCRRLAAPHAWAVIDALALFEGGLAELCEVTVAVCAPEEVRVARLVAREQITPEYAQKRIAAQRAQDDFRRDCDFVLENDKTQADFRAKCLAFFRQICIMKAENKTEVNSYDQ